MPLGAAHKAREEEKKMRSESREISSVDYKGGKKERRRRCNSCVRWQKNVKRLRRSGECPGKEIFFLYIIIQVKENIFRVQLL